MKLQRVYLVLLFSLVLINAGSNSEFSKGVYEQPNKEQYELIDYLKESNLTLGYGDYWDANTITYLSKEEIVVRSVVFTDAKITPYKWLSFKRWFTKPTINDGNVFILQSDLQNEEIENLVLKNPPKEILKFGDYKIYVWDISELRSMMEGFN
jgi:hypothetical protein